MFKVLYSVKKTTNSSNFKVSCDGDTQTLLIDSG